MNSESAAQGRCEACALEAAAFRCLDGEGDVCGECEDCTPSAAWRHPLRWLSNKIVEWLAQEIASGLADALADELAPRIQRELMKRSVSRV